MLIFVAGVVAATVPGDHCDIKLVFKGPWDRNRLSRLGNIRGPTSPNSPSFLLATGKPPLVAVDSARLCRTGCIPCDSSGEERPFRLVDRALSYRDMASFGILV